MAIDDPKTLVSTKWLADHLSDPDLRVLDASWYLPEMNRDPISTTQFRKHRHRHWIGFHRATRFANVGDVIDIDAQAGHRGLCR